MLSLQNVIFRDADFRFRVTIVLYTKFLTSFHDLWPRVFSSSMHSMQCSFPGTLRSAIKFPKCLCTALLSASLHGLFTFSLGVSTNDKQTEHKILISQTGFCLLSHITYQIVGLHDLIKVNFEYIVKCIIYFYTLNNNEFLLPIC